MLYEICIVVFPVFLIIGLGYGLRRSDLLNDAFFSGANWLVFNITLPLLLFYKISQTDFRTFFNPRLIAGSAGCILIGFALSYAYGAIRRFPPPQLGAFCQGSFRGNLAIVGLAVVYNAFGNEGLTRAGIFLGFIVPWLNLLAVVALLLPHRHGASRGIGFWAKHILLNPLIIGSLLGMGWSQLGSPLPQLLDRSIGILANMTLPLALLAIGGGLSVERMRGDFNRAWLSTLSKIAFQPALALLILPPLGVHGIDLGIGTLMLGSPAASASYIMASQMKGDSELASSIIVLSTLFSILTYSLTLWILKTLYL